MKKVKKVLRKEQLKTLHKNSLRLFLQIDIKHPDTSIGMLLYF